MLHAGTSLDAEVELQRAIGLVACGKRNILQLALRIGDLEQMSTWLVGK